MLYTTLSYVLTGAADLRFNVINKLINTFPPVICSQCFWLKSVAFFQELPTPILFTNLYLVLIFPSKFFMAIFPTNITTFGAGS